MFFVYGRLNMGYNISVLYIEIINVQSMMIV